MDCAHLILTDSGGIQEEAPPLGKPVLVMRDTTERTEAVTAGTVKLVGTDSQRIILAVGELLNNRKVYDEMSRAHSPYGNGDSCKLILNALYGESQIYPKTQQKTPSANKEIFI
jgi:UDP-N-acetylglucosamine 2-epimerase (non-hydrolysing)